ncbi:MAG: TonB-dependent receptor plug domain-containing protein, partial [Schleiferiaceae bacterium]
MKRVILPALAVMLSAAGLRAQSEEFSDTMFVTDLLLRTQLDAVDVIGTWAKKEDPIAQINLTKKDIESINTGRDLPYVLQDVAGVVSFSDAGNGVGYTNMRVRGSDVSRINVTVNGIPMNDAESHGVFWVNTPDLMSST